MLCIFVRGKVGSGKTFLANILLRLDDKYHLLDPDLIDVNSTEFKKFKPRSYKNPELKIKKYCFLFHKARSLLEQNKKVLWVQPWSRENELVITIKNFGYYFTDLKNKVWEKRLDEIIKQLPLRLAIIQINLSNDEVVQRCINVKKKGQVEIEEIKKHSIMFQNVNLPIRKLEISGKENSEIIYNSLAKFLKSLDEV